MNLSIDSDDNEVHDIIDKDNGNDLFRIGEDNDDDEKNYTTMERNTQPQNENRGLLWTVVGRKTSRMQ